MISGLDPWAGAAFLTHAVGGRHESSGIGPTRITLTCRTIFTGRCRDHLTRSVDGWLCMPRPVTGHRDVTRVELRLSQQLAERVYRYAKVEGMTLSQSGERLLEFALIELASDAAPHRRPDADGGDHSSEA